MRSTVVGVGVLFFLWIVGFSLSIRGGLIHLLARRRPWWPFVINVPNGHRGPA